MDDLNFDDNSVPSWAEEGEVVAKFFSPIEAEMAAARLRSEGIHCFLANTVSQSVMPNIQTVIRLHVRPQEVDAARSILKEAAIEAGQVEPSSGSGMGAILILAVVIGVLLAFLLIQALSLSGGR